jgi:hypothetical protein
MYHFGLLKKTMGLSCTCSLAKTIKEGKPISLVDIQSLEEVEI